MNQQEIEQCIAAKEWESSTSISQTRKVMHVDDVRALLAKAVPEGSVVVPRKAAAEAITQLQRAQHRDAAEGLRIAYALTDLQTAVPEQQTAPGCVICEMEGSAGLCGLEFKGGKRGCVNTDPRFDKLFCGHDRACHKEAR